ncbi:MAG: flippase-like domain-containing protein [Eubacteriaceae bacterium]|nr:flippase-like domain-containing protein [Eubacteriaceae bacterium]
MKKTKNTIKLVAVLTLSLLTLIIFSRSYPNMDLKSILLRFQWPYLFVAAMSFVFYLLSETFAFSYLLKVNGHKIPVGRIFGYTLHDYFFSTITPGGSGGQPGQFYAMQRDRIPPAHCLTTLFTFNAVYHIAMLFIAVWAMTMGATQMVAKIPAMKMLTVYGIGAQILFVALLTALLLTEDLVPKGIFLFFHGIRRIPLLKKFACTQEKLQQQCEEYQVSSAFIKSNPIVFLKTFIYILPMLLFFYAIPYCLYRGLGYHHLGLWQMIAIQSVAVVALESVPLPGSVGVGELSLTAVYALIIPLPEAFVLMFLTRALHLYFGLLLSAIGVLTMKEKPILREGKSLKKLDKNKIGIVRKAEFVQ